MTWNSQYRLIYHNQRHTCPVLARKRRFSSHLIFFYFIPKNMTTEPSQTSLMAGYLIGVPMKSKSNRSPPRNANNKSCAIIVSQYISNIFVNDWHQTY